MIEYVSAPLEFDFGADAAHDDPMQEDKPTGGLGSTGGDHTDPGDPNAEFKKVFGRFASAEEVTAERKNEDPEALPGPPTRDASAPNVEEDEEERKDGGARDALSKKQRKMLSRLKVSDLKQACERPEVVEVWDVTAPDPHLLVYIKGCRWANDATRPSNITPCPLDPLSRAGTRCPFLAIGLRSESI